MTAQHATTTDQRSEGAWGNPGSQGVRQIRRILLIANETVGAPAVRDRIRSLVGDGPAEVFVVAPALTTSAFKHVAGDVDEAIEAARERLEASVEALRASGLDAAGTVGDSDPNLALEDALRRFDADEVVISTHPPERSKWLEQDVVEKARCEISQPVTHVIVDDGGSVTEVERVKEPGPPAADARATATAYDLPRMPLRDVAGIVVGIAGTIVLAILAIICSGDVSEQGMSAGCAIRIGFAAAAFVVTLFHVLALLFFGSVRYRGRWGSLAATTLIFGIPPAILVSLLVD
jgi:hypothetical protein